MAAIRVHELAKELKRQNKEVIEFLKAEGVEVKSHMSNLAEPQAALVRKKFKNTGKEKSIALETPKTEEQKVVNNDAEKTEAPKKKKNIIRVYHAQNASDGGKSRPKKPAGERKPRPQGAHPQQEHVRHSPVPSSRRSRRKQKLLK